jgi:hypothetical protein
MAKSGERGYDNHGFRMSSRNLGDRQTHGSGGPRIDPQERSERLKGFDIPAEPVFSITPKKWICQSAPGAWRLHLL